MRVAVVGGGPGGLFLAALLRRDGVDVDVFERNRADDTFGFGVVFSDRTLAAIDAADPVLRDGLREHGVHWDTIEVRLKGEVHRCGGNGMAAISRRVLLGLLQDRAAGAGAALHFSREVGLADLDAYDLVVGADGTGSRLREALADRVRATVDVATAKFIWFGTEHRFDGLTFLHERGPHGVFAVHGYPISADVGTFIVETDEATWRAAGLDAFDVTQPPGPSDLVSQAYLEDLFAMRLLVNNSRWGNFRTRRSERWTVLDPRPVAFLGDAVHTAHFSVGSGTKMAMEDAIALAAALATHPVPDALAAYEAAARPSVERIQDSARPSLAWWEHFGRYHDHFAPWQFGYHFLTRSIDDGRLARRAPEFVAASHAHWRAEHGAEPLATPLTVGGVPLPGRRVTIEGGRLAGIPLHDHDPGASATGTRADGDHDARDDSEARVTAEPGARDGRIELGARDGWIGAESGARDGRIEPGARDGRIELGARDGRIEPVPGARVEAASGVWGARIAAPPDESGLPPVLAAIARCAAAGASVVAVHGGTALTRTLVCEEVRMVHGLPALLEDERATDDTRTTALLSGRADLVT